MARKPYWLRCASSAITITLRRSVRTGYSSCHPRVENFCKVVKITLFQMMGVFAEFERAMIRERVLAGLARAKEQGISLGRRRLEDSDAAKVAAIKRALAAKQGCGGSRGTWKLVSGHRFAYQERIGSVESRSA